jgi:hypothetical protein
MINLSNFHVKPDFAPIFATPLDPRASVLYCLELFLTVLDACSNLERELMCVKTVPIFGPLEHDPL